VIESNVKTVATACPFCMIMMSDGLKNEKKDKEIQILDIAEIVSEEISEE
jgi:Fe-S oxidoreductase